jgi:hypothetical protein
MLHATLNDVLSAAKHGAAPLAAITAQSSATILKNELRSGFIHAPLSSVPLGNRTLVFE